MKQKTCLGFALILILSALVSCTARPEAPQAAPTETTPKLSPTEGKKAPPSPLPSPTSTDRPTATPVPEDSGTLTATLLGLWSCSDTSQELTGYSLWEFLPDGTLLRDHFLENAGEQSPRWTYEIVGEFSAKLDRGEDSETLQIRDRKKDSATFRTEFDEFLCQRLPPVPNLDAALVGTWVCPDSYEQALGFTSNGKLIVLAGAVGTYRVISSNTVSLLFEGYEPFFLSPTSITSDMLIFDNLEHDGNLGDPYVFRRFPEVPNLAQRIIGKWRKPGNINTVLEFRASGKAINAAGKVTPYRVENNNTIIFQPGDGPSGYQISLVVSASDQELVVTGDPGDRSRDTHLIRAQP